MNCCLQKSTTYQFTYIIYSYYLFQDKFKNSKMIKIQHVYQSYIENYFSIIFKLFSHLNLMQLKKHI